MNRATQLATRYRLCAERLLSTAANENWNPAERDLLTCLANHYERMAEALETTSGLQERQVYVTWAA